jgi:hypothetical protein
LICLDLRGLRRWQCCEVTTIGDLMRRFAPKAIFALLTLNRAENKSPPWDRIILIFSTAVTIGLVALYVFGKATSRW